MAKIHTHYDNLKVARLAPQEVIRAAYKALSQKYHPDKNPGDEKAARIMAILNSAYGTLSDPVRRKEHDEWIVAEEWEIEWLESTRSEEGRERHRLDAQAWDPSPVDAPPPYRRVRDPKWWLALVGCFGVGCAVGALLLGQPKVLPMALAKAAGDRPEALIDARDGVTAAERAETRAATRHSDPAPDGWALGQYGPPPSGAATPEVKALAVTQFIVPERAPECDTELHTLAAPNGEPWPLQSGYLDGYPVGNRGVEMQLLVDNSVNASPVFVKVYDLDRRSNVRHVFVQARDSLAIDKLAAGKYELRYQNIVVGSSAAECAGRKKRALRQAAANPPEPDAGGQQR